jgi:hypothetical protein
MDVKRCVKCGETKPLGAFWTHPRSRDGYWHRCSDCMRIPPRKRTYSPAKFWASVAVGAPDECWPWAGCRDHAGYGRVRLGGREGRSEKAHRIALAMSGRDDVLLPFPDGAVVMHACDNPPCCNPAHLSLGTRRYNAKRAEPTTPEAPASSKKEVA